MEVVKKEPKYWMKATVWWCPVCLSESRSYRRMPLPKPEHWEDRQEWETSYDYCDQM